MEPETRIVYWNKTLKELWTPRIERIRQAYQQTEIAVTITGMRRVYVYHVNSTRFDASYEFLRKNKLAFFPTNKSAIYSGFSHKHIDVKPGDPYILYGAAVSVDDLEAGELFVESTHARPTDHAGIGRLLSYPECCINHFGEVWPDVSIDPIYETALHTDGAVVDGGEVSVAHHPYCNNMLKYFSIRITPHITCGAQCAETVKWGEEWFDLMTQIDSEAATWAKELLSMPMTWDCLKGVAIVDTPVFRGITNSDDTPVKKRVFNPGWVE